MELLTTGQVARALGVSINTVKSWIRRGAIDAMALPSGHHRIPRRELDRLVHHGPRWATASAAHRSTSTVPIDDVMEWIDAVLRLAALRDPPVPTDPEETVRHVQILHARLAALSE